MFTERITLDTKKQIFVSILNQRNKEFTTKHPNFIKTLDKLIPHRNIFAHLEVEKVKDNGDFVFKKYKSGKLIPQIYSREKMWNIFMEMTYVNQQLNILIQEMPPLS